MNNCTNPININTTNVDYFGFKATYKPFEKEVAFSIANFTTFKSGGEANITSVAFEITTPLNETKTGSLNPSIGQNEVILTGFDSGQIFFGQYKIKATLTEQDNSTYTIDVTNNVCYDNRLNNANYITASESIKPTPDCGTARLEVYDQTNYKYNSLEKVGFVYNGVLTYPNNYLPQRSISYLPYSLDLANSITGVYQIQMVVYISYALECNSILEIQYRSQVNQEILCGAGMCQLTCCWMDALAIVERGGTQGSMMQDKMNEAEKYYNAAFLLYTCGKNNDKEIAKVREILDCSCRCSDVVLIQPKPIVFGGANLIGSCGTTITTDENGDIVFHSFAYTFTTSEGSGIQLNTVQINDCTRQTTITLNIADIEDLLYTYITNNEEILTKWQDLFSGQSCNGTPNIDFDVTGVGVLPEDLQVTDSLNFTNNHAFEMLSISNDTTLPSGNTLKYLRVLAPKMGIATATSMDSDNYSLEASGCANAYDVISIAVEVETNRGCYAVKNCNLVKEQIDYSERYSMPYRFNAQINDLAIMPDVNYAPNVDKGILYFSDTSFKNSSSSNGTIVRKINLNTGEVVTISGKSSQQANTKTYNGLLGDEVVYGYGSTVIIDKNEIHNGEPVIYMGTFGKSASEGGVVCRIVKESNCCGCDERKNWRTYVLVNPTNAYTATPPFYNNETGDNVILKNTYGIKRWYDVDGDKISFYIKNADLLYHMYYSGSGSMNNASNWIVNTVVEDPAAPTLFTFGGGFNTNINVENYSGGEGFEGKRLIAMYQSRIEFIEWTDTASPTANECRDFSNLNYNRYDIICTTLEGTTDGIYDTTGSCNQTPAVFNPCHIFHVDDGSPYGYYLLGQNGFSGANASAIRRIRQANSTDYEYSTLTLPSATGAVGTSGDFTLLTTNGLSGGFFVDLQGNVLDFTYGGFRLWRINLGYCEVLFGGSAAGETQTQYAQLAQPLRCDTQFKFDLNC